MINKIVAFHHFDMLYDAPKALRKNSQCVWRGYLREIAISITFRSNLDEIWGFQFLPWLVHLPHKIEKKIGKNKIKSLVYKALVDISNSIGMK